MLTVGRLDHFHLGLVLMFEHLSCLLLRCLDYFNLGRLHFLDNFDLLLFSFVDDSDPGSLGFLDDLDLRSPLLRHLDHLHFLPLQPGNLLLRLLNLQLVRIDRLFAVINL